MNNRQRILPTLSNDTKINKEPNNKRIVIPRQAPCKHQGSVVSRGSLFFGLNRKNIIINTFHWYIKEQTLNGVPKIESKNVKNTIIFRFFYVCLFTLYFLRMCTYYLYCLHFQTWNAFFLMIQLCSFSFTSR